MSKGLIGGMGDYSNQSFNDISQELLNEKISITAFLENIYNDIGTLEKINYWNENVISSFREIINFSTQYYITTQNELIEIINEIKVEVKEHHVKRLKRIAGVARQINIDIGINWNRDYEESGLKEYGNSHFQIVEKIYKNVRDEAVNLLDITNIADRLNDYIGMQSLTNDQKTKKSKLEFNHTTALLGLLLTLIGLFFGNNICGRFMDKYDSKSEGTKNHSTSMSQIFNIYNCDKIDMESNFITDDYKPNNEWPDGSAHILTSVPIREDVIRSKKVLMNKLKCRFKSRANIEKDNQAIDALKIIEKDGINGLVKIDSILKYSYDIYLVEYNNNNVKQEKVKYKLAEIAYELATASRIQLKFDSAKVYYRSAVEFYPNYIEYHIELAHSYFDFGDIDSAFIVLKNAEEYLVESKNNNKYYFSLAYLYYCLGKTDSAICYLHAKGLDSANANYIDSNIVEYFYYTGFSSFLNGNYDKTIEYLKSALSIDSIFFGESNKRSILYSRLAIAWGANGDYNKALDYFSKALTIDTIKYRDEYNNVHPDIADDYFGIAFAWLSKGDYKKAINYMNKSLSISKLILPNKHPFFAKLFSNLGYSWYSIGNYDKAIEYYFKALHIDTLIYVNNHQDIVSCYNDIGLVYYSKGNYEKALLYYQYGIELNPLVDNGDSALIKDLQNNLIATRRKLETNTKKN